MARTPRYLFGRHNEPELQAVIDHTMTGGGGGGSGSGGGSGGGSSSGGGAASSEVGVVVPLDAATSYMLTDLPAGDEFELTLDGVVTSENPPSPAGYISWAGSHFDDRCCVMINTTGDGAVAAGSYPNMDLNWTQEQFFAHLAAVPSVKNAVGAYRNLPPAGPGGYYVVEFMTGGFPSYWLYLGKEPGWDYARPSVLTAADTDDTKLGNWNALLTRRDFKPWTAINEPEWALAAVPKNIMLLPNGLAAGTQSVVVGSDGAASEQAALTDEGLLLARAWSGPDWRLLAKSNLSMKPDNDRILAGTCAALSGGDKRAFTLGGTWEDSSTPLTSLGLDFGGAEFTGTLAIVPKAVVSA